MTSESAGPVPDRTWWTVAVLGPLLAGSVAAGGIVWGVLDPPSPVVQAPTAAPAPLTAQARALLGGLSRGDGLVGWSVTAVSGPDDTGAIRVQLRHRALAFSLMLAPKGSRPEPPPVQTEHWAVYYGHVDPPDAALSRNAIRATTNALANLVRAHE